MGALKRRSQPPAQGAWPWRAVVAGCVAASVPVEVGVAVGSWSTVNAAAGLTAPIAAPNAVGVGAGVAVGVAVGTVTTAGRAINPGGNRVTTTSHPTTNTAANSPRPRSAPAQRRLGRGGATATAMTDGAGATGSAGM